MSTVWSRGRVDERRVCQYAWPRARDGLQFCPSTIIAVGFVSTGGITAPCKRAGRSLKGVLTVVIIAGRRDTGWKTGERKMRGDGCSGVVVVAWSF